VFTAEEQDITNLLDVGFNDIEEMYSINSLGQISIFEWQNDNLRREDTQYQLRLPNQLLAKEVTTISSMFSACDESLNVYIGGQEGLFAKIAAVGIERESVRELTMNVQSDGSYSISEEGADLQVGMWVTLRFGGSNFQHRVIQVDTPQLGFVQTPISAVIIGNESELVEKIIGSDTSGTPRLALLLSNTNSSTGSWDAVDGARENTADFAIDAKAAYWPIELTWPNLIDSYYSDIIDALKTPQVIKAWFNLSVAVFVTLDFLKPVYIQEFNAFYYINKIEQFKYEKKTRLELVRISANTNISG
jgi:hypothetical protein